MTKNEEAILVEYAYGKVIEEEHKELLERAALIGLVCFGTGCTSENGKIKTMNSEARLTARGHRSLKTAMSWRFWRYPLFYLRRSIQVLLVRFYYKFEGVENA